MVDRTVYPDKDKVPELALRQIFGRQKLPESLCLLMADKGMLLVERMAMLGDNIVSVKATLKAIVGDNPKFGIDAPAQELSLTLLCSPGAYLRSPSEDGRGSVEDLRNSRRRSCGIPGDLRHSAP